MRMYSTNCENRQQIWFIDQFDVLNGVSNFCSVYHLVYRFEYCFYRIYPSVYNFVYHFFDTYCTMYKKYSTYFDTYCNMYHFFDTRLQYVSFFWYTNACVSKLFGVSNRVSNLADRVQRDVSKWARKIYFNRKVNIRSAYYSRKYRINAILETCFCHKSWC